MVRITCSECHRKKFRVHKILLVANNECRSCYRKLYGHARPITSRSKSSNKYRRCRMRRRNSTVKKIVAKPIAKRSKSNVNPME